MIVRIDKSFQKDVNKINDAKLKLGIAEIIESIQNLQDFSSIKNLKKLTGHTDLYRVRLGDYRIGLRYSDQEFTFIRFLHRKEIYKKWP